MFKIKIMLRWKLKMGAKKEAVLGAVGFNQHVYFNVLATKHFGYSKPPPKKIKFKKLQDNLIS